MLQAGELKYAHHCSQQQAGETWQGTMQQHTSARNNKEVGGNRTDVLASPEVYLGIANPSKGFSSFRATRD